MSTDTLEWFILFFAILLVVLLFVKRKRNHQLHPEKYPPLTKKRFFVLYAVPTLIWICVHFYMFYYPGCKSLGSGNFSGLILLALPFYYFLFVGTLALILPAITKGDKKADTKRILKFGLYMYPLSIIAGGMLAELVCTN